MRNPSEAFLQERALNAAGSTVTVTLEGSRPILVEVQALTSPSVYGLPRRSAVGFDQGRLQLLVAVLQKRAGLNLSDQTSIPTRSADCVSPNRLLIWRSRRRLHRHSTTK